MQVICCSTYLPLYYDLLPVSERVHDLQQIIPEGRVDVRDGHRHSQEAHQKSLREGRDGEGVRGGMRGREERDGEGGMEREGGEGVRGGMRGRGMGGRDGEGEGGRRGSEGRNEREGGEGGEGGGWRGMEREREGGRRGVRGGMRGMERGGEGWRGREEREWRGREERGGEGGRRGRGGEGGRMDTRPRPHATPTCPHIYLENGLCQDKAQTVIFVGEQQPGVVQQHRQQVLPGCLVQHPTHDNVLVESQNLPTQILLCNQTNVMR